MSTFTEKKDLVTAYSFEEFVEHMKKNTPHPHWHAEIVIGDIIVKITHENDEKYLIVNQNGEVFDFVPGEFLVLEADGAIIMQAEEFHKHFIEVTE